MAPDVQIHDVVSSWPDILEKEFDESMDFVFLGTDGIFDVLSNRKVVEIIWGTINYYKGKTLDKKSVLEEAINNVMRKALIKDSDDNITGILICFRNILFWVHILQKKYQFYLSLKINNFSR